MFEIKTQAFFAAAHHLLNYDGECENQHGHNWMVEVFVKGDTLDKSNILMDYKVLKKELKTVLDMLDHKDLRKSVKRNDFNVHFQQIERKSCSIK